jgi:NAD(P)-dependent dehydrogenase (short-subunit alcohol dehydrogenase family)
MEHKDSRDFTLITGASSAIGGAIAIRLSQARRLVLSGRDEARLNEVRLACSSPDSHAIWRRDLGDVETLQNSLEEFLQGHSFRVAAFIHCAGVTSISAVRAISYLMLKRIVDINFSSAALITSTLVKKQVNFDALGHVVFITSIFSRMGAKGQSLYCATKAALDGLMRGFAVELAPRVRVNSILPGAVPSPMAAGAFSSNQISSLLRKNYPLGIGTPEAIAGVADFLLSSDADWITGQEIVVDGGRIINHPFE